MRLWSLHPSLLDRAGLVAVWREALLAQHVLRGKTKGYRFHPQLQRFRDCRAPLTAISAYLRALHDEAIRRGYSFDASKIARRKGPLTLPVTQGQVEFELDHLKKKLKHRDQERYLMMRHVRNAAIHPLFTVVPGKIESWERIP